jgi:hypothetical protein
MLRPVAWVEFVFANTGFVALLILEARATPKIMRIQCAVVKPLTVIAAR